jgi:TonB family protein
LILFIFIEVGMDFQAAEYAEIGFISSSRSSSPAREREAPPARTQPESPPPPPPERTVPEEQPKQEPVKLPARRMLEDEQPQLIDREAGKYSPDMDVQRPQVDRGVYESTRQTAGIGQSQTGEKVSTLPGDAPSGAGTTGPATDVGSPSQQGQNFTIEGDAAQRTILTKIIPDYPPDLQKEAVVKIRFTVRPDGSVGQMVPMQKGDPTLEEITLRALRQWRFNPLGQSENRENVTGIITFRYELK